jgi:hypothetical protein
MEQVIVDRLKAEIEYEFERTGYPDGFPVLQDVPAGRYTDPRFYDLELKHMWPKVWLFAGRSEALPEPGSYQIWDYSGPSIILVRDQDAKIRAFLNESPNNAPLVPFVDEGENLHEAPFDAPGRLFVQVAFPRRQLPGGVLRCQRKGWTYDLEGRLIDVPSGQVMASIAHKDRALTEFRCETWGGFVFVNRSR